MAFGRQEISQAVGVRTRPFFVKMCPINFLTFLDVERQFSYNLREKDHVKARNDTALP